MKYQVGFAINTVNIKVTDSEDTAIQKESINLWKKLSWKNFNWINLYLAIKSNSIHNSRMKHYSWIKS